MKTAKFIPIKFQNCNAYFHVTLIAIQQRPLQPQLSPQRQLLLPVQQRLLQILATIYAMIIVT